jgi:putative methionine-R-sulfoxide reductase with GAF domain
MESIALAEADKPARYREVVAVLDLDSYGLAAFDDADAAGLAPIAELLGTLAW